MKKADEKTAYLVSVKSTPMAIEQYMNGQSKLVMAFDKDHARNVALPLFKNVNLTVSDLAAKKI